MPRGQIKSGARDVPKAALVMTEVHIPDGRREQCPGEAQGSMLSAVSIPF